MTTDLIRPAAIESRLATFARLRKSRLDVPLSDMDRGLALFTPPDATQGRIASKRIKKWNPPE